MWICKNLEICGKLCWNKKGIKIVLRCVEIKWFLCYFSRGFYFIEGCNKILYIVELFFKVELDMDSE